MQQYATKFADLVEQVANKVKEMTIDRVAQAIRLTGLGILAGAMGFTALIFLAWAIFGALEIPLTKAGAFAVIGALFIGAGGYMWFKRA